MMKNKCKECGSKITKSFRYTDWWNEENDVWGTYEECLAVFNKAIKENDSLRCSIYDFSGCDCDHKEEGILFNENCPEYKE